MRVHILRGLFALLLAAGLASRAARAQDTKSSADIVNGLLPPPAPSGSRGIRPVDPGAPPPADQPEPTTHHTRTAGGATRTAPPASPSASLHVEFASGSATLTPAAIRTLGNLGSALADQKLAAYRFRIEGHTDTVGSAALNQPLSARRAQAVVDFIVSHYHLDPGRLEATGVGEDGLLIQTPPQTPESRNRRVEIINLGT